MRNLSGWKYGLLDSHRSGCYRLLNGIRSESLGAWLLPLFLRFVWPPIWIALHDVPPLLDCTLPRMRLELPLLCHQVTDLSIRQFQIESVVEFQSCPNDRLRPWCQVPLLAFRPPVWPCRWTLNGRSTIRGRHLGKHKGRKKLRANYALWLPPA